MAQQRDYHILIVDDDPKVRLLLRRCFESESYRVSEAATRSDVDQALSREALDLITLDLTLPDGDGLTIARDIRARSSVPIVMVTGKGDMIDRIVGLEIGADDYIAKPFHVREVLARVRAVLRRFEAAATPVASASGGLAVAAAPTPAADDVYRFGDWVIDIPKREVRRASGESCPLTTSEFGLLELFVRHPKRVLSRDQIMDLLRGHDWSPLDRSIDNLVARLRKKVEDDPEDPRLIKTVRGIGYSFTADVAPL
jgi:DNA-binding response OmpR family regulator